MFIPAILLYALVWFIQNTRKKKERKGFDCSGRA
jgi:cbb3-type cytochrome oxidase subunit 3